MKTYLISSEGNLAKVLVTKAMSYGLKKAQFWVLLDELDEFVELVSQSQSIEEVRRQWHWAS